MRKRCRGVKILLAVTICIIVCGTSVYASENEEKTSTMRKYLGSSVYAGKSDGYAKSEKIEEDNPHYSWKLGDFYVSGFTRALDENTENPIFLKNVGDKVKLSFLLKQDIDKLNGNDELTISSDDDGYDEYFGVEKTDFGRGMLIVKYTDYQGQVAEPTLHKDYLKAVKLNADTEIQLCEEGDYEVALDYSIDIDKGFWEVWKQGTYDYRIFFKFSVRNGNCMV